MGAPKKMTAAELLPILKEAFTDSCLLEFIGKQVSSVVVTRIESLENSLTEKGEKIRYLEERIAQLEEQSDTQEQYSRRTSIRINGIKETQGEDVEKTFMSIMDGVAGITVTKNDINRAHRVGPKSSATNKSHSRQIIIQFKDYKSKVNIMRNKRHIDRTEFPHVFINEDLTKKRANLLYKARCKKKDGKISDCWTYDGRLVIKDKDSNIKNINHERELEDL